MKMIKIASAGLGLSAAGAALVALSPIAASASSPSITASCPKGDVCVWSGKNATGIRCNWDGDDPDWLGGNVQCTDNGRPYPSGRPFRVNSIWNNGYTTTPYNKVRFFRQAGYGVQISDPVMVTPRSINAADLSIRSHVWSR